MTQEEVNNILSNENCKNLIEYKEFYFQKGQDALNKWLNLSVNDSLKAQLIKLGEDYEKLKQVHNSSTELKEIIDLLFEITSYSDVHANEKDKYNKYDDKRTIAKAGVRMGNWIAGLIKFKFKHEPITGSILNAFNYLLDPQNNTTILSEKHRDAIAANLFKKEYDSKNFVADLKNFYSQYNIQATNPDNYTQILSVLIYEMGKEWKDEVVGLMASDGTKWQDDYIEKIKDYDACIIWNSKRPSGTDNTIKFLKNIISEGKSFPLFYSIGGFVNYKAEIIDFAESQEHLDNKQWDKKHKTLYYKNYFADYKDNTKAARIVFLAKSISKIDPIAIDDFEFYDGFSAPRQDNLSPIKAIPKTEINAENKLFSSNQFNSEDFEELDKMNYKEEYTTWLNSTNPNDSGTKSSYLRAIEILSSIVKYNIFEVDNLDKIDFLYRDLIKEQRIVGGKYYHKEAVSYGDKGFYSAAIKTYSVFLKQYKKTNTITFTEPLNTILFGPPGTGKTYNSINRALEIINDEDVKAINWDDREDVKRVFDKKIADGQIVFTTFHQSMSYEDFIEGIKPLKPKVDDTFIKYDVLPGIFMSLCERAKSNFENAKTSNNLKLSFEVAFQKLQDEWEDNPNIKFPLKTSGKDFTIIGFTNTSIQFKKASGGISHTLSIHTLKELYYGKEIDFNSGLGIYYPSVLSKIKEYSEKDYFSYMPTDKINLPDNDNVVKLKNYVMIIDEINRGNVSQIFGELITLIEDDKRIGKPESLEVILPYSKSKFGVPPNLYLVGTMNTADRSVEALDTALRRRFAFEEIPPKYDLAELQYTYAGVKGSEILQTINKRIEKLLDKDHLIGHSYFILKAGESANDKLKNSFYKNIIPLLQEYFFGDFGKIGLVLGQGFVNLKNWDDKVDSFAEFDHESSGDFESKDVYEIIDYRESNNYEVNKVKMDFEKAIKRLMKLNIA